MNDEKKLVFKQYLVRIAIVVVVLAVLIILIVLALRETSTSSGSEEVSLKTEAIVCKSENQSYPYAIENNTDLAQSREMRIVGTYDNADNVDKISLNYTVYFKSHEDAVLGEAMIHGEFGKRLVNDGLPFSELKNNFAIVDKKVVFSLNATVNDITEKNYQYLMLSSYPANGLKIGTFKHDVEARGFECD